MRPSAPALSTSRNWFAHAFILAFAFIAMGWQLMHPGYYSMVADDIAFAHKYILQFTESFRQGILYPRWMADCFGGYGSPVFVYYSPALYYLAGLLGLAGIGPSVSVSILQLLSLYVGSAAVYYLVKRSFGHRAGLISAALYCTIPTRLVFLYYINSFAGRFAEAFMPLTLLFVLKLVEEPFSRKNLAGASLSYAALMLSHLATAYIFTPFLIAFAFLYTGIPARTVLTRLVLVLIAGMGAASVLFVPVLFERGYIHIGMLGTYLKYNDFVFNLTGASPPRTEPLRQVLMVSLAAGAGLAASVFFLAWRRHGLTPVRKPVFLLVSAGACLFFMSSLSATLWKLLPGLSSVALSFRFAAVFMVFVPVIIGIGIDRLLSSKVPLLAALSAGVLAAAFLNYDYRLVSAASAPVTEQTAGTAWKDTEMPEYLPAWVPPGYVSGPRRDDSRLTVTGGSAQIKKWDYVYREIGFTGGSGGILRLKTFWFPGWRAWVDGSETTVSVEKDSGAILISVPPGSHSVQLYFTNTPPRKWGKNISLLTLVALAFPYVAIRRRRHIHRSGQ